MSSPVTIKRALISCWDKNGILKLARALQKNKVEIISSGGTARYLTGHGISVIPVENVTGFPEILNGRVKTLHPAIHAAILAKRTPQHLAQLHELGIEPFDLVVVNLYPFVQNINQKKSLAEMIELIDIGGPAMLRAAAKNYQYVTVLHSPDQYEDFLKVWKENKLQIPVEYNLKLCSELFFHTSYYDSQISEYLSSVKLSEKLPQRISRFYMKMTDLRYGENPHQDAAIYRQPDQKVQNRKIIQLAGKEMSYNNYVDVISAAALVEEFSDPMVAVVKHTNPCGAAIAEDLAMAFVNARAGDPASAFGGIVAANREIDEKTAKLIHETFFECIIAPDFSEAALAVLKTKKNLRLLKKTDSLTQAGLEFRYLPVGLLAQEPDRVSLDPQKLLSVTRRIPDAEEEKDLFFAWKIAKHVKSNAIVFAAKGKILGVGAGQMSRVDSVKLARLKAEEAGHKLKGAVMASDAFFPFRDGIDTAARAGITAVIQPGGSVRDQEVIDAANEHNISMIFTNIRHFKH
jgi:phosphoribosylaminoimidazolecarboxamide formyltransferase/IMP cyclohydrolase